MNRSIEHILLAVTMVFLLSSVALAVEPPHNFACNACHTPNPVLKTTGFNNLCISCHKVGKTAERRPFEPGDLANPYGTTPGFPKIGTQSTHNWEAPSDGTSPSGAQPPLNSSLASGYLAAGNVVSCNVCHNIKLSTPTDNLLRIDNSSDQICVDCHRSRNNTTADAGSHPVMISYSAAVAADPTHFNKMPVNANPANYTSDLGKYLKNGQVVCMTCHNPHYADSSSATLDNLSSVRPVMKLKASKGTLLRTDRFGADAQSTTINACNTCHAGKVQHSSDGHEGIQCDTCHSGHVDYIKSTDPVQTPNVYLLRRYLQYSTATTQSRQIVYTTTDLTQADWKRSDGRGVCQACHVIPAGVTAQHDDPTVTKRSDCIACHNLWPTSHDVKPTACNGCHGFPPAADHTGGPDGYANVYGTDATANPNGITESTTPHTLHASIDPATKVYGYSCGECHKGNSHATGTYHDVFKDTTGILAGTSATYTTTGAVCSNVYCHSNGNGLWKPAMQNISWKNGKGTIVGTANECKTCHDVGATGYDTGAHQLHVAGGTYNQYSCDTCHSTVASGSTAIKNYSLHVNGVKNVAFGSMTSARYVPSSGTTPASCTNRCHSDGAGGPPVQAPTWVKGSLVPLCGSCHKSNDISTNAHPIHTTAAYGPHITGCANSCHNFNGNINSPLHVNGTVDFVANACSTCHPQSTPAWTAGGQPVCSSCHTGTLSVVNGVTAPDVSKYSTTGHGQFLGAGETCTVCHDPNSQHIAVPGGTKRLNTVLGDGTTNQECNYCHHDATKVTNAAFLNMSTHFVSKGVQGSLCSTCHDPHGSTNVHMLRSSIVSPADGQPHTISILTDSAGGATDWVNTTTNYGFCQVCHTQTAHYRAGVPDTTGHPTSGCGSCHKHNPTNGGGAFKPSADCNSCHGYPPLPKNVGLVQGTDFGVAGKYQYGQFEDYSGGGGAHVVAQHVNPNANKADGWANCGVCHNGGASHQMITPVSTHISNVKVAVDPKLRFNSTQFITYSGAHQVNPPAVNKTGSCFNASCHFKPSPRWSTER